MVGHIDEQLIRDWVPHDLKTRILYHYTTAAGLIGILGSGVIRGTNAAFLNDSSELEHGLAVCLDTLNRERADRTNASNEN